MPLGEYNWRSHISETYMQWFEDRLRPAILNDKEVFQQFIFQMNVQQRYKVSQPQQDLQAAKEMKLKM